MKKRHERIRAWIAGAVILALMAMVAVPAFAASNHAIAGTVYSPCSQAGWVWFNSGTQRTKAGQGAIKAKFSDINPGGLNFRLLDVHNAIIGHTQQWGPNETNIWRTFAGNVANGKRFHNSFKQLQGNCGKGNYNFTGTEFY